MYDINRVILYAFSPRLVIAYRNARARNEYHCSRRTDIWTCCLRVWDTVSRTAHRRCTGCCVGEFRANGWPAPDRACGSRRPRLSYLLRTPTKTQKWKKRNTNEPVGPENLQLMYQYCDVIALLRAIFTVLYTRTTCTLYSIGLFHLFLIVLKNTGA